MFRLRPVCQVPQVVVKRYSAVSLKVVKTSSLRILTADCGRMVGLAARSFDLLFDAALACRPAAA